MYRIDIIFRYKVFLALELPLIELAILGLLKEHDRHGYELKKQLTHIMGPDTSISFGSLYPALARLERSGSVAVPTIKPPTLLPNIPMTGALSGELTAFKNRLLQTKEPAVNRRGKKVYRITTKGAEHFESLMLDHNHDDRVFALKVTFCQFLTPTQCVELFEHRRVALQTQISQRKKQQDTDTYTQSLFAHTTQTLIHNLAWVEDLLAHARAEVDAYATIQTTLQPL